ncbi:MAG TPA: hypothetical protein DCR24_04665 [Bacillus bacterium]|nr:hypothetical protein [Bacillus sp. (in: firmicutes)]
MENELPAKQVELLTQKLLQNWNQSRIELEGLFKNRDSEQALNVMTHAIELFKEFLYLSNGHRSNGEINIEDFSIKPVNVKERLNFIISRPRLFHSFVQLSELFFEQEKQYAKYVALTRRTKSPD